MVAFLPALIGAAATVGGGLLASRGASNAADAQVQGTQDATAEQARQYDQTRQDFAPQRRMGQNAMRGLAFETGLRGRPQGYRGFRQTPGYQFRRDEGMGAVQNTLAASGMLGSGSALKAAQRYGQGVAADEYGSYINRLQSLAGVGQSTNNTLASLGAQNAANIGNLAMAGGNARAQGYVDQGNVMNTALQGLGGIAGRYFAPQPTTYAPPQAPMPVARPGSVFG